MSSKLLLLLAPCAAAFAQYAGSAACGGCHPAQYKSQSVTPHARALQKASPEAKADWAFGSGEQAITYVNRLADGDYLEQGRSWFAASKAMALTPGHSNASGVRYRLFDPGAQILRCFQCHSTGTLRLTEDEAIQPSEAGVRCESCHGPGSRHIERKGDRLEIFSPSRLTAAGVNELCGACHRKPPAAGEDTDWTNAWNTRHQPLYLSQSKCFRKSNGKLSCFTCHDPHGGSKPADAACTGCHAGATHKTAIASRSCAGCHMPKVRPHPQLAFSNHWIGVYGQSPLRPAR